AGAGYLRDGEDRAQRGDGLRVSIGVVAERVAQGEVARTSGGARGADLARVGGLAEPVHGVELPEGTFQIAGIHTVNQAGVRLAEQGHAGWRRVVQTVRHARGIRRLVVGVVELPELRSRRDVDCEHIYSVAARLVRRGEGREHGRVVAAEQRRLHRLAGSQVDVVELARGGPSRVAERGQVVVGGCAGGRAHVSGAAVVLPLERLLAC